MWRDNSPGGKSRWAKLIRAGAEVHMLEWQNRRRPKIPIPLTVPMVASPCPSEVKASSPPGQEGHSTAPLDDHTTLTLVVHPYPLEHPLHTPESTARETPLPVPTPVWPPSVPFPKRHDPVSKPAPRGMKRRDTTQPPSSAPASKRRLAITKGKGSEPPEDVIQGSIAAEADRPHGDVVGVEE